MRANRLSATRWSLALLAIASWFGCSEQPQVTRQTIPKQDAIQLDVGRAVATASDDAVPKWKLPSGWRREPSSSSMRFATLRAGDVEFSVIPLPFPGGDEQGYLLSNVNRWREQLQMPPVAAEALATETEQIGLAGDSTATLVDIEGWQGSEATGDPTHRMLAAVVRHGDKAWFFKGTAATDQFSGSLAEEFKNLIRSTTFTGQPTVSGQTAQVVDGRMPPDHPPVGPASPVSPANGTGKPALTFDAPDGWKVGERGSMRRAAFVVNGGGQQAEITVIDLPGRAGDLLSNVNRWRDQVGLAGLNSVDQIESEDITVAGKSATYLRIDGKEDQTILAAVVPDVDRVWFFKLSGIRVLAEREEANFRKFVESVKFPPAGT